MHHAATVIRGLVSRTCIAVVSFFVLVGIGTADTRIPAQAPDTILVNGKFVVYDGAPAQALAVRNGRLEAIGNSPDIRALAGPSTRVIDVGGRTVIPGLIDSHIHAIRAGLTYTTEVHWIGVRTLAEALARIRVAAKTAPKGSWLVVAGGWTDRQFSEDRRPTQAEIAAAAPDHLVYIQQLYSRVLLDPGGADALGIAGDPELAARVIVERDKKDNGEARAGYGAAPYWRCMVHSVSMNMSLAPGGVRRLILICLKPDFTQEIWTSSGRTSLLRWPR